MLSSDVGRGPADCGDEQVALDGSPVAIVTRSHAAVGATTAALGLHDVAAGSGIDDADDVDSGATEVVDGGVAFVVGGQDDRPLTRLSPPRG